MTLSFWKDALVRAVKTFAQVVLALLGTGYVGITSLDWAHLLGVASTAALASVLTSVVSLSNVGTPSSTDPEPLVIPAVPLSGVVPDLTPRVEVVPAPESTPTV